MRTMAELEKYVSEKAKEYWEETGSAINSFPNSIVEFVIEYVCNNCHFPDHFAEKDIVSVLEKGKNSLVMACVDIHSKAGADGQTMHVENGITRMYKSSWITFDLISNFPNYVKIIGR